MTADTWVMYRRKILFEWIVIGNHFLQLATHLTVSRRLAVTMFLKHINTSAFWVLLWKARTATGVTLSLVISAHSHPLYNTLWWLGGLHNVIVYYLNGFTTKQLQCFISLMTLQDEHVGSTASGYSQELITLSKVCATSNVAHVIEI